MTLEALEIETASDVRKSRDLRNLQWTPIVAGALTPRHHPGRPCPSRSACHRGNRYHRHRCRAPRRQRDRQQQNRYFTNACQYRDPGLLHRYRLASGCGCGLGRSGGRRATPRRNAAFRLDAAFKPDEPAAKHLAAAVHSHAELTPFETVYHDLQDRALRQRGRFLFRRGQLRFLRSLTRVDSLPLYLGI